MGAGVIPFSIRDKDVYFLFQRTFTGRKIGYLIDFGGGLGEGENYQEAAIRKFIEESETMYFSDNLQLAKRSIESVKAQIPTVTALFDKTLAIPLITTVSAPQSINLNRKTGKPSLSNFPIEILPN